MSENHFQSNFPHQIQSEFNFQPNNNSEMSFNYQNQSMDMNGNPNIVMGRLYHERNNSIVVFILIIFLNFFIE